MTVIWCEISSNRCKYERIWCFCCLIFKQKNLNVAVEATFNVIFFSVAVICCEISSNRCRYEEIDCIRCLNFKRNNLMFQINRFFNFTEISIFFQVLFLWVHYGVLSPGPQYSYNWSRRFMMDCFWIMLIKRSLCVRFCESYDRN